MLTLTSYLEWLHSQDNLHFRTKNRSRDRGIFQNDKASFKTMTHYSYVRTRLISESKTTRTMENYFHNWTFKYCFQYVREVHRN